MVALSSKGGAKLEGKPTTTSSRQFQRLDAALWPYSTWCATLRNLGWKKKCRGSDPASFNGDPCWGNRTMPKCRVIMRSFLPKKIVSGASNFMEYGAPLMFWGWQTKGFRLIPVGGPVGTHRSVRIIYGSLRSIGELRSGNIYIDIVSLYMYTLINTLCIHRYTEVRIYFYIYILTSENQCIQFSLGTSMHWSIVFAEWKWMRHDVFIETPSLLNLLTRWDICGWCSRLLCWTWCIPSPFETELITLTWEYSKMAWPCHLWDLWKFNWCSKDYSKRMDLQKIISHKHI